MAKPFDPDLHCGAHPDHPEKGPCRARKGFGTDHVGFGRCKHHGGNSPGGKTQAGREQAAEAVRTYGLPLDIDPATALLDEVKRSAGAVAWLEERVAAIDPDALIRGTRYARKTTSTLQGDTTSTEVGPLVHAWLQLYREERAHLVKVCAAALNAGVEERRVRIAERQGEQLAAVIRGILDDLQLTPDQLDRVREIVPRHLRLVAG